MTRETKIGLLVGLAFIIVIGVLLSDHLTTRGELTKAELTQVGQNVRTASAVPAGAAPPIAPVMVPQNVAPVTPVLTQQELNQRPATSIVQIGPAPVVQPQVQVAGDASAGLGVTTPAAAVQPPAVLSAPIPDTTPYGQSLIAVAATTPNPADEMKPVAPNQPPQVAANPTLRAIKAEKGDSVSRWAAKYLGANTGANRQAIIDANPTLKANPALVILGNTYMIPERSAMTAAASATPSAAIPETVPASSGLVSLDARRVEELMGRRTETTQSRPAARGSSYTVKNNDTLWAIASRLGDAGLVKEIQAMNQDVLKGKTILQPGMTLKLPARTVNR